MTRSDRNTFWCIAVLAIAIRLVFVAFVRPAPVSDFHWYVTHAVALAQGLGYETDGVPTALWPIGWPLVLAGIFRLFNGSVFAAEIFQAIAGGLTAGVVALIGRRIGGNAGGLIGGALYAFSPSAIEWTSVLGADVLYTLLTALAALIWLSVPETALGWFAISGTLLGAAAIVRPLALLLWVPLLVYLLIANRRRLSLGLIAAPVFAVIVCTIVVVAPLTIRNEIALKAFVPVSTNGGITLWEGNNPHANGNYAPVDDPRLRSMRSDPRQEVALDDLATRLAVRYAETHPLRELRLTASRMKNLFADDAEPVKYGLEEAGASASASDAVLALNRVSYAALVLLAVVGLVVLIRRRSSPGWVLLLALIVYNTAIFAVSIGADRYRFPMMPYFAAFAGAGLYAILRRWLRLERAEPTQA